MYIPEELWASSAHEAVRKACQAHSSTHWNRILGYASESSKIMQTSNDELHYHSDNNQTCDFTKKHNIQSNVEAGAHVLAGIVLEVSNWEQLRQHENASNKISALEKYNDSSNTGEVNVRNCKLRYLCVALGSGTRCVGVEEEYLERSSSSSSSWSSSMINLHKAEPKENENIECKLKCNPSRNTFSQNATNCVNNIDRCVKIDIDAATSTTKYTNAKSKTVITQLENALLAPLRMTDGQAEVMARRAFIAFLLDGMSWLLSQESVNEKHVHPFIKLNTFTDSSANWKETQELESPQTNADNLTFALREGVRVCLVCTHWPCGAMSTVALHKPSGKLLLQTPFTSLVKESPREEFPCEDLPETEPSHTERNNNFVDICNKEHGNTTEGLQHKEETQSFHNHVVASHYSENDVNAMFRTCARLKPGKGKPNLNMSCSDKL